MKIADHAVRLMTEQGLGTVLFGDGILTSIGCAAGMNAHPIAVMGRVLNALERDSRFIKGYYRGHDIAGRPRRVRGFKLMEEQ